MSIRRKINEPNRTIPNTEKTRRTNHQGAWLRGAGLVG